MKKKQEERLNDAPVSEDTEMKRLPRWAKITFIAALCAMLASAIFAGGWFSYYGTIDSRLHSLEWAIGITEENYYKEITEDELYDNLFQAFRDGLDDGFSYYIAPAKYDEIIQESAGNNKGIGASFSSRSNDAANGGRATLRASKITGNSPAQKGGIREGMYVLAYGTSENDLIDYTDYAQYDEFFAAQENDVDFILRCGYLLDGFDAINCTVRKADYLATYGYYRDSETGYCFQGDATTQITEIDNALVGLDEDTAYICLDRFTAQVANEFTQLLNKMKERGRTNLVLDMRSNGGGYIHILNQIATHLLKNAEESNPVVATAHYRTYDEQFRASGNDYYNYFTDESKIYVLVNSGTASASESLLGAMLDYGTIDYGDIYIHKTSDYVEGKTYGKGIMQTYYSNITGEALRLTTATIHWPISDTCINGVGITESDGAKAITAAAKGAEDEFLDKFLLTINQP